jgi:hypothetical protein
MESTIAIVRWRSGLSEGPIDPFRNRREHLSQDGQTWLEVSVLRSFKIIQNPPLRQIGTSPECEQQIVRLISERGEEPLGHQLFREAWTDRQTRPASALVIGVAAAEVGFKKLVGSLIPEAQWLVDDIQTPYLVRMLRKFLPTLPVKFRFQGKSICPPNVLLKRLDRAIECNKLVHAGQPPPNIDELEEMLRAVNDFLWICDVYAGYGWAHQYILLRALN